MQLNTVHDFRERLAFSHAAEDLPVWGEVYSKAFPDMIEMVTYRQDGFWQREGIDRGIILSTTKQIFIDEKVRERRYTDVALEFVSNDSTKAAGWVCKPLRADYIAYLIAPLGECYLLPVIQLQSAWAKCGAEWMARYGQKHAQNRGYRTWFCPVPRDEIFRAIGQELRVKFEPFNT
jgi:hypothetical protein